MWVRLCGGKGGKGTYGRRGKELGAFPREGGNIWLSMGRLPAISRPKS